MSRNLVLYLIGRFSTGTAGTLLRAAVAWHVYSLSRSAFYLGLLGIVQFLPMLPLTLVGGAVADSYDRRRVLNAAQALLLAVGVLLLQTTRTGAASLTLLYVGVALASVAHAFEAPARSALLPALVPPERFPRAVTIASTCQALAFVTGPALAGIVIAYVGVAAAYASYIALIMLAFLAVLALTAGGGAVQRGTVNLRGIREGLAFVWRQPVILSCMSLDLFAVIFGGATALLPIYAQDILHAGARGYGALTSSFELGALAMAIVLVLRRPFQRAGRALLMAVAVFGVATVIFGLSRALPLSLGAYLVAGMADQVSVVMRATAVQLSTPDALRGRVSAVNMVFIAASNQLGAAESGFVAALTTPTFTVVSGGIACLVIVAIVAWRVPALRRYTITTS